MTIDIFANNASATVSAGGTTAPAAGTSESWTLASIVRLAASTGVTQMRLIDPAAPSEVMLLTNLSGTAATVTRGVEGTTPVAHAANFTVDAVASGAALTKGSWQEVTRSTLASTAIEIDITIPSDAVALRVTGRNFWVSDSSNGTDGLWVRFNSDSGNDYISGNTTTLANSITGLSIPGNQAFITGWAAGSNNGLFEIVVSIAANKITQVMGWSNPGSVRTGLTLQTLAGMWLKNPYAAPTTLNLIDGSALGWQPGAAITVEKIA